MQKARRLLPPIALTCALALVAGCGKGKTYTPSAVFTQVAPLAEFTSNGVHVTIALELDSEGQLLLRAALSPTDQGFHLYSKDLKPEKLGGAGIPTRMELLSAANVKATGPLFADVEPHALEFKSIGGMVPVYPEGRVILRLPIKITGSDADLPAQLSLSYMACSDRICLPPVDRKILVKIPTSHPAPNHAAIVHGGFTSLSYIRQLARRCEQHL